uniref:Sesquipedalian n=1 Tax=Suricata suricatta TaxID=37032 RepID=A0A673V2S9_SURSU
MGLFWRECGRRPGGRGPCSVFWVPAAPCATTRRSCRRCPGSRPSWRPSLACGAPRKAAVRGPGRRGGRARARAGGRAGGRGWVVTEPARAQPVFVVLKRRLVKLVVNFLFYFRTDEAEVGWPGRRPGAGGGRGHRGGSPPPFPCAPSSPQPVGALLLEHCRVTQEEPSGFSISFIEDPERKYHFECCSEEQCQEWMGALRRASYEFMRRSLIFYRNEIRKMTGKDPLEQFGISEEARFQLGGVKA